MHFQIWLCYSTVWHFQRSQPLLVHLVPAMSMFLCSTWVFLGQVSEVWALLGPQKGLIGIADQFSAGPCDLSCLTLLLWSLRSNQWTDGLLSGLQSYSCSRGDVSLHSKDYLTSRRCQSKRKQHNKTADLKFLTVKLKILNHPSGSLRFGFLQCTLHPCPLQRISTMDIHQEYDSSSCSIRYWLTVGKEKQSKVVDLSV